MKAVKAQDKPIYGKATVELLLTKEMVEVAKSCSLSNDEYASCYLKMKMEDFSRLGQIIDMVKMRLYYDYRT